MQHIAKEKIENGDRIDGVKDHCAFVEQEFGPGMFVRLRHKSDHICVDNVTEENVQGDAQDPPEQNLIVSVNALINATEGNHEASEERES